VQVSSFFKNPLCSIYKYVYKLIELPVSLNHPVLPIIIMVAVRRICQVPGCSMGEGGGPYVTLLNLTTQEYVLQDMRQHLNVHQLAVRAGPAPESSGSKVTRIERPKLQDQCSDVEWELFVKQWTRYKRGTAVVGQVLLNQLWACMDPSLEKAANNDGADQVTTKDELLACIKRLAVKGQNVLVNIVKFLKMGQEREEPIST
jgi:hypothetical protein